MEIVATGQLITINEAANWVSSFLRRKINESNISYLIQYGKVRKHNGSGNTVFVNRQELEDHYQSFNGKRELNWKKRLGDDLNWALSFDHLRERDTTKHVHRLHPYKGKFIPQLVAYFIDNHTDSFKTQTFFKKGDIEYKYAKEKESEFLKIYDGLIQKHKVKLTQDKKETFLDKWYIKNVRDEIDFAFEQIKKVKNEKNKRIIAVILSRTIRSCRATTHSDLATLKEPRLTTYYCWKHKKICKPLFSIKYWFNSYANDTMSRLKEFQKRARIRGEKILC